MKRYITVCLALLLSALYSCASKPVVQPPEWRYEKEAIYLNLKADYGLNLHDGKPHTLLVCVYQLRDPNAFNQLTEYEDGLYKLLECSRFDTAVASSRRLIIHPGENFRLALDRAEGARYVAIVAGYYMLERKGVVRLYDIPWVVEEKGFLRRTAVSKPVTLNIDLILGPQQIYRFHRQIYR